MARQHRNNQQWSNGSAAVGMRVEAQAKIEKAKGTLATTATKFVFLFRSGGGPREFFVTYNSKSS